MPNESQACATGYHIVMDSPLGRLIVRGTLAAIERIETVPENVRPATTSSSNDTDVDKGFDTDVDIGFASNVAPIDSAPWLAAEQLREYFQGKRREFSVPLAARGTEFQMRAWNVLAQIPYGETRTYQQQALRLGGAEMARAVGAANRRNPLPIIVPCHRVIGKNGSLTGFALGLDAKRILLSLESGSPVQMPLWSTLKRYPM